MAKNTPEYSLETLCETMRRGNCVWRGRSQLDFENLEYTEDDLINCMCSITSAHYDKTLEYPCERGNKTEIYDVYLVKFKCSNGNTDDLYIKLMVKPWIIIGSFHLDR